jgi:starvation-inducible DNA-binding protein
MLDPQVDAVRDMVEATAERIATPAGSPIGGALVAQRHWRTTRIESQRRVIGETETLDAVRQDMLLGQAPRLELFQWFGRGLLEDLRGQLTGPGR